METITKNPKNIQITSHEHHHHQEEEEEDKYKISYIIHFLLGAGNLLPWNALITGVDYFEYLYPNKHIEKLFSVVYMTSSLLVLAVMLSLESCRRSLSLRLRMNIGYSMFAISLMATPIMNWAWLKNNGEEMSSHAGYVLVIVSVLICGFADGLIGASLIGTTGKLPKQYMQAVFAGTASSGVLISVLRIITKASLPQTPQGLKTSAQSYFIVSSAILIICIICCNLLYKLPTMQHYYRPNSFLSYKLPACDDSNVNNNHYSTLSLPPKLCHTLNKIKFPCFGIFAIYTVTLSIFPGYLSENNIKSDVLRDWYPIVLISTYNVFDFVGKSLTGFYVTKDVRRATWCCLARVLLYPLFVMCLRGPRWLRNEAVVVVLTMVLGLSNGYLTSVLMILTPKVVEGEEAEVAAIVMVVMLGVGLVSGSVVGWLWII